METTTRLPIRLTILAALLGASCALAGCGNKGPLLKPATEAAPVEEAPAAESPPSSDPTDAQPPPEIPPPPAADPATTPTPTVPPADGGGNG